MRQPDDIHGRRANPLIGADYRCNACGFEATLGPGNAMNLAMCWGCGASLKIEYRDVLFGACTEKSPGTLIWFDSDAVRVDDRDNAVELRSDVLPLPGTSTPDLWQDVCPKCAHVDSIMLSIRNRSRCPSCATGRLIKVGSWIQ